MKIQFSFRRYFIEPGKTLAMTTAAGARVRVVDGLVWATTSSSRDDLWLAAGDEHTVGEPGLTVIEAADRATVEIELASPSSSRARARYEIARLRTLGNLGALAMAIVTMALLVVLPARMSVPLRETLPLERSVIPVRIVGDRNVGSGATQPMLVQPANGSALWSRIR